MRAKFFLCMIPALMLFAGCGTLDPDGLRPWPKGMVLVKGGMLAINSVMSAGKPLDSVTVSSFYMDKTEVTQEEYLTLIGNNPSVYTENPRCAVNWVSWYDAVRFCNARSKRDGLDTVYSYTGHTTNPWGYFDLLVRVVADTAKNGYRLPTKAEWLYACCAGTATRYYWGNSIDGRYCWYAANTVYFRAQPVAMKIPNAWGLYDMMGNVEEWCHDRYEESVIGSSDNTIQDLYWPDTSRILCGGSVYMYDLPAAAESSYDISYDYFWDLGFRCVCSAKTPSTNINDN